MLRRRWRLGLRKTAAGLRPLCDFSPPHFFVAAGTKKCHIQLERYAKFFEIVVKMITK
jgi:hypothetical protein